MADIPDNIKSLVFGKGAKWHATTMFILNWLGLACLVVGIIGDAINKTLGLEATSWLLIAIALWVWGLAAWLAAYFAAKEG